jgi:hypothetical protein
MIDNDLGGHGHLFQGAVGSDAGVARWPKLPDPANDSGARPVRDGNAEDAILALDRPHEMIEVEIVPLAELLDLRPFWDLVHIDIQGTEVELCTDCIDALTARVRWLVIGTHSRKLDGDLMELFFSAGWALEHEKPARMVPRIGVPLGAMCSADGTQVWHNPRL